MIGKTAYILGAGASRTANLPIQSGILPLIFSIQRDIEQLEEKDFLSLNINEKIERVNEIYPIFDGYRKSLGEFIVENFSSEDKVHQYRVAINYIKNLKEINFQQKNEFLFKAYDIAKSVNISLEDLFTIFDNVAIGREHFRLYSPEKMWEIHNKLKLCVIYSFAYSLAIECDDNQYRRFSKFLLKLQLASKKKENVISVISMNWDNVLERTLFELCTEHNSTVRRANQKVYPDLCFYDYSLSDKLGHIPSTHIKAKGHKNIKILKMHGSIGWLECPKCGRVYTDFIRDIAVDEYSGVQCPNCKLSDSSLNGNPVLRNLIITPTFMKSFSNLNLKNIWHNAYINISEADNLIFIGYSFPDADFEMRCLLKKAIKSDVKITVVLHNSDDPQKYIDIFLKKGYSIEEANQLTSKLLLPETRYKSFFGEDKVEFCYKGFQGFLDEIGVEI